MEKKKNKIKPQRFIYHSNPNPGPDSWRVEERFRDWGEKLIKTGDEFTDWVAATRKEAIEATLEEELRELFLKEVKNG